MKNDPKIIISTGNFLRLGAYLQGDQLEFSVICKSNSLSFCLYEKNSDSLIGEYKIPDEYKRGDVYSFTVSGIKDTEGLKYRYKTKEGILFAPYAQKVYGRDEWNNHKECYYGISKIKIQKQMGACDYSKLVIYKASLRGLTMDKPISDRNKGTFKGIIDHIPTLKKLGINTLMLLPIYEFDETKEDGSINYWGYGDDNPYYFAPKASFFGGANDASLNMSLMVEKLHDAGIRLIMEVCIYPYMSENQIIKVLRHWAFAYGVDGFSIIGEGFNPVPIKEDPYLSDTILIFENYPVDRIQQGDKKQLFLSNDSYLYPVRRLLNNMDESVWELANMLQRQESEYGFINYVAASNGFTLYDSFSYSHKHNEDNGENNTDGNNYNCSSNTGMEGETRDKVIIAKRLTKIRTSLAALMLSQSIPMLVAGDELLNSAQGNNNPYCQDNKIGWVNYSRKKDSLKLKEYFANLCKFRKNHPIICCAKPLKMNDYRHVGLPDISYHGREPWILNADDSHKSLGILLVGSYGHEKASADTAEDVMILFNFYFKEEEFNLPVISDKNWYLVNNTKSFDFTSEKITKGVVRVPGGTLSILVAR